MAEIKFDSAGSNRCTYCTRSVLPNDDTVVIGTRTVLLVYHRDCDSIARAERVHMYQQFLRSQEPLKRKETL